MYLGIKKPQEIEKAAQAGHLLVYDIEGLELENPSLVTDTTREAAYKKEISLRIGQAIGGFQYGVKLRKGSYEDSIHALQDAEKRITEANAKQYQIDYSILETTIQKIIQIVSQNFTGSIALLSYLENSSIDVSEYKQEIKQNLPSNQKQYVNEELCLARRTAKNLRRTYKNDTDIIGGLEQSLKELYKFSSDVDISTEINEIKNIAYRRGVEFIVTKAQEYLSTKPKKVKQLLEKAAKNAKILEKYSPLG